MDAIRIARSLVVFVIVLCCGSHSAEAQMARLSNLGHAQVRSENFIVKAATQTLADEIARAAEQQRHELAVHWLGKPIPNWSQPCPITVSAGPQIGAGGSTTFTMSQGSVGHWRMNVQGSRERILDSVLPHEITHTIFASHFAPLGKPVPRWADEGACTTVEHDSEKSKHNHFLVEFLSQGRGIPFAIMFDLKEYPSDIMPLYAQGYSVSSFLIAQGGPRRFVEFLEDGMRTEDWVAATEKHYSYPKIGKLQSAWNKWVGDGGGSINRHTADALGLSRRALAANTRVVPENQVALVSGTKPNNSMNSMATDSWYKRQLQSTVATQDPVEPANTVVQAATAPNPFGSDYSVSHPQPMQTMGGQSPVHWAAGPSLPIYR